MARKKSAREKADEKRRFYMYLSYREQMDMLTDEELGRLMRYVYDYIETGEKKKDVPLVNMLLSVITTQYDIDKENYMETIEQNRENGRKGGEKSAEMRKAKAKQNVQSDEESDEETYDKSNVEDEVIAEDEVIIENESVVQKGTPASQCEPMEKIEPDREIDRETDRLTDRVKEENKNYYYYSRSRSAGDGGKSQGESQSEFIPYGQEQHLTTRAEVEKFEALAGELMHTYRNKKATPYDCEKVFGYVHTLGITDDGEHYGIYSDKKADLLRHVFDEAAVRSDLNWQYINRIYLNYDKHRVTSVEEAIAYEQQWKNGEIA